MRAPLKTTPAAIIAANPMRTDIETARFSPMVARKLLSVASRSAMLDTTGNVLMRS